MESRHAGNALAILEMVIVGAGKADAGDRVMLLAGLALLPLYLCDGEAITVFVWRLRPQGCLNSLGKQAAVPNGETLRRKQD